jgi:hypothetical protein
VDCAAYYIVGSIVRNTLAVIIVMIFAVFDENPGGFAEKFFENSRYSLEMDEEEGIG